MSNKLSSHRRLAGAKGQPATVALKNATAHERAAVWNLEQWTNQMSDLVRREDVLLWINGVNKVIHFKRFINISIQDTTLELY